MLARRDKPVTVLQPVVLEVVPVGGMPPIIPSESEKHLNTDARKEESVSELMQLMSWWKLAETICVVSVLLALPQDSNMGTSLYTDVSHDKNT